jgi:hypothetical protein
MSRRIRLGESLVEAGLIDTAQLEQALARTATTGERIGEALVALGFIAERDLIRTLAKDAEIQFLESAELRVDPTVVSLVTATTARAHNLVPLRADGRALVVAMGNPFDVGVIRSLERATGRQIRTVTGDPAVIAQLVQSHYGNEISRGAPDAPARPVWTPSPRAAHAATPPPYGGAVNDTPQLLEFEEARSQARRAGGVVRRGARMLARQRSFAALIDQDGVVVLEYKQEPAGFRLLDSRRRARRYARPEDAADAVIELLDEMHARNAAVSVVLQRFGAFFHTLAHSPSPEEQLRPVVQREIQRSFNIADPAFAINAQSARQLLVAGAPRSVVDALQSRFVESAVHVDILTVTPEAFRQLYGALDGSQETSAVLVCLAAGPHLAFFVNGQLELAIEPRLTLEGESPLDHAVIVDQLERGAIFLRQQARGAVATRLLLSAPAAEYETMASAIEARTGMHVAPLGQGVGSPDSVVALGAVLASRAKAKLDFLPRPPALDRRLKSAVSGPALITTTFLAAAAVAALWAGAQLLTLQRERQALEEVQARVERELPAVDRIRRSSQGRAQIASIRAALLDASIEKASIGALMSAISGAPQQGTQLDSLRMARVAGGIRTTLYGHANGASGSAAMGVVSSFFRRFERESGLKNLAFESSFLPREGITKAARTSEELKFSISATSPVGAK